MDKFEEIKTIIEEIGVDVEKFYKKGNGEAGKRVRLVMQQIKSIAQDIRLDISNKKKAAKEAKG